MSFDPQSQPSPQSSRDLAQQASRAEDPAGPAVEELLLRHLEGLRTFVRVRMGRVVRGRERESDLVQSTCREILTQRANFRYGGEAGFRHWLYTTALRKLVDRRDFHTAAKRDARREEAPRATDSAAPAEPLGQLPSPSAVARTAEELDRMEAAFRLLDEDQREVILLSRVVGLPRADVAREMGRSEGSVRNLLYRSLAELARHLERSA